MTGNGENPKTRDAVPKFEKRLIDSGVSKDKAHRIARETAKRHHRRNG